MRRPVNVIYLLRKYQKNRCDDTILFIDLKRVITQYFYIVLRFILSNHKKYQIHKFYFDLQKSKLYFQGTIKLCTKVFWILCYNFIDHLEMYVYLILSDTGDQLK